ncbi:MAG: hypothetical protein PWP64_198 [Candidatus Cloacimonadota bacterium]|nr:hypothetical protein [Candidatus Cloacimonadota bacterium]
MRYPLSVPTKLTRYWHSIGMLSKMLFLLNSGLSILHYRLHGFHRFFDKERLSVMRYPLSVPTKLTRYWHSIGMLSIMLFLRNSGLSILHYRLHGFHRFFYKERLSVMRYPLSVPTKLTRYWHSIGMLSKMLFLRNSGLSILHYRLHGFHRFFDKERLCVMRYPLSVPTKLTRYWHSIGMLSKMLFLRNSGLSILHLG